MLTHHTLECPKSSLNAESRWLDNGSFLLTESFCKKYLFRVTSLRCILVNPFVVVHPTHILVYPRVHRAHRLKSAGLCNCCRTMFNASLCCHKFKQQTLVEQQLIVKHGF